jgi:hypothetical protein
MKKALIAVGYGILWITVIGMVFITVWGKVG